MSIIRRWQRSCYKRMLKARLVTPKVVVLMDGGICSQMLQYLLGEFFRKRGCKVVYDLSFYKEWGSDMDYKFARNFDLLKVFPYLGLTIATEFEISYYKRHFYYVGNNTSEWIDDFSFLEKNPPIYLGGYYHLPINIWVPAFMSTYRISSEIFDEGSKMLMSEIKWNINPVAVHVRRGDLSVEVRAYGKPASLSYFKRAVDYMEKETVMPFFYFFSDEPEWVASELIPYLEFANENYKVVDINGSDKGYMDLFLIAYCKHQITSKGTLGKYGALLRDSADKIVILCDDKVEYQWKGVFHNSVFL